MNEKPVQVISPKARGMLKGLFEIWQYRYLFLFFSWRFIRSRYRKTVIGWPWLILRSIIPVILATVVFGNLLDVPSNEVPYPLFYIAGSCTWGLFSNSLVRMTRSLESSRRFLSKIYFPKLIIVGSCLAPFLVELIVNFVVFVGLNFYYAKSQGHWYWVMDFRFFSVFYFLILAALCALSIGMWTSVLNAQARDVRLTMPYFLQACAFLTPVYYPLSKVPEKWHWLVLLNPMANIVEGVKWSLLGAGEVHPTYLLLSSALIFVALWVGYAFFHHNEMRMVDRI